jgi:hypothetical protein
MTVHHHTYVIVNTRQDAVHKIDHIGTSYEYLRRIRGAPSSLPHFLDNRLTDGGEVVNLMRRPPLPSGRILVLNSDRD